MMRRTGFLFGLMFLWPPVMDAAGTPIDDVPPGIVVTFGVDEGTAVNDSLTVTIDYPSDPESNYVVDTFGLNDNGIDLPFDPDNDLIRGPGLSSLGTNDGSFTRTFNTSGLTEGSHTLTLAVTFTNGVNVSRSSQFIIDHTPPSCVPAAQNPANNSWINGYRSFQVQATDALSGVSGVRLKNPLNPAQTFPYLPMVGTNNWLYPNYDTHVLSDGLNVIEDFCFDGAGNQSLPTGTLVRVDNTPPVATLAVNPGPIIFAGSSENLVRGMETLAVNATDGNGIGIGSNPIYKLDGSVIPATPLNTGGYANGAHLLEATVADDLGNSTVVSQTLTFDNSGPAINIVSPTEGQIMPANILSQIQASFNDAHGVSPLPTIIIDGLSAPFTQAGNTYTLNSSIIAPGPHTLRFQARDTLGNQSERIVNFYIADTVVGGPLLTNFITPLNGDYVHGSINVKAITTGATIDGGLFKVNGIDSYQGTLTGTPGVFEATVPLDTFNGAVTLDAIPTIARIEQPSKSISVIVDNTPPVVSSLVPQGAVNGTVQVLGNVLDDRELSHVELFIDNVSVATLDPSAGALSATIGYSWNTVSIPGSHVVRVDVTDRAGNMGSLSNTVMVQFGTLPQISIITPHQNDVLRGIAPLRMHVIGTVIGAGFRIDGGPLIAGTPVVGTDEYMFDLNTTIYTAGHHNIDFIAANGVPTVFQNVQVWIDNTPPALTVSRPFDDQTIFSPIAFKDNASDSSGLPLGSVAFKINTVPVAFFSGNTDLTNTAYTYLFDPAALDSNGDRIYPDGVYSLTVIATDQAGNTTQQTIAFNINIAHPPISAATLTWSPQQSSVVGQQAVSVTVANGAFDPTYVNDDSLKIYVTKDGEVEKRLTGPVQLQGNTLRFLGIVPENCRVKCVVSAVSMQSDLIPGTQQFISAMPRSKGGIITLLPEGLLRVSIPVNGLEKDALVELTRQPENQFPDISPNANVLTVYGPIGLSAQDTSGAPLTNLLLPAQLIFQRQVSNIPPAQQSGFVDAAQIYESSRNIWKDVNNNEAASLTAKATPGVRAITVPVSKFGVYRITSVPIPSQGISELYNAPNPFSPAEGGTNFNYLLGDNSEVNIVVYDLFGNLVRRIDIGSGASGGAAGPNLVNWNGKNGQGDTVANGGYIVQVTAKDTSGHVARVRRKVAVAK